MTHEEGIRCVIKKRSMRCDFLDQSSFFSLGGSHSQESSKSNSIMSHRKFNSMDSVDVSNESSSESILSSRMKSDCDSESIMSFIESQERKDSFSNSYDESFRKNDISDIYQNNYRSSCDPPIKPKLIIDILSERAKSGNCIKMQPEVSQVLKIKQETQSTTKTCSYKTQQVLGLSGKQPLIRMRTFKNKYNLSCVAVPNFKIKQKTPYLKYRKSLVLKFSKLSINLKANENHQSQKLNNTAINGSYYKREKSTFIRFKKVSERKFSLLSTKDLSTELESLNSLPKIKLLKDSTIKVSSYQKLKTGSPFYLSSGPTSCKVISTLLKTNFKQSCLSPTKLT